MTQIADQVIVIDAEYRDFIRNPQALQIAESLVIECLYVAEEQGVNLNLAEVMDSLLLISRASSSMIARCAKRVRPTRWRPWPNFATSILTEACA